MFIITMPLDFSVGEIREIKINFQSERLEWKDGRTLSYGGSDYRIVDAMFLETERGPATKFCCKEIPDALEVPPELVTPLLAHVVYFQHLLGAAFCPEIDTEDNRILFQHEWLWRGVQLRWHEDEIVCFLGEVTWNGEPDVDFCLALEKVKSYCKNEGIKIEADYLYPFQPEIRAVTGPMKARQPDEVHEIIEGIKQRATATATATGTEQAKASGTLPMFA